MLAHVETEPAALRVCHAPSGSLIAVLDERSVTLRDAESLASIRHVTRPAAMPGAIVFVGDEVLAVTARVVELFSTTDAALLLRHDPNEQRYGYLSVHAVAWAGGSTLAFADDGGRDESEFVIHRSGVAKLRVLDWQLGEHRDVPLRVLRAGLRGGDGGVWALTSEGIVDVPHAPTELGPPAPRCEQARNFDVRDDRIALLYTQSRGLSAALIRAGRRRTLSSLTPPPGWLRLGDDWLAIGGLAYGVRVFDQG